MYRQQRADSLADWNMQNDYNSPTAQMARFRDAGLSPHLIYGNGANASDAGPVRASDTGNWNPRAPQVDLGGAMGAGLGAYYDIKLKEAQYDNLKEQNNVIHNDALLRAAQTVGTLSSAGKTNVDTQLAQISLEVSKALQETSIAQGKANLANTEANTKVTLAENERKAAANVPAVLKVYEEIENLRSQRALNTETIQKIKMEIENLIKDGKLKEYEIKLNEAGLQKNDSLIMRVLGRFLTGDMSPEAKKQMGGYWEKTLGVDPYKQNP